MKHLVSALLLGVLGSHGAQANQALAASKNCMACHAVEHKIVGPAFSAVAAKYAGEKTAQDMLVQKIQKGGAGVWGEMPMPANSQLSTADAKKLTAWILALPPKAP